jgi:hypothetical protein
MPRYHQYAQGHRISHRRRIRDSLCPPVREPGFVGPPTLAQYARELIAAGESYAAVAEKIDRKHGVVRYVVHHPQAVLFPKNNRGKSR